MTLVGKHGKRSHLLLGSAFLEILLPKTYINPKSYIAPYNPFEELLDYSSYWDNGKEMETTIHGLGFKGLGFYVALWTPIKG